MNKDGITQNKKIIQGQNHSAVNWIFVEDFGAVFSRLFYQINTQYEKKSNISNTFWI